MTKEQIKAIEDAKLRYLELMVKICEKGTYPFDLTKVTKKDNK